jgi:general secretion pathway protein J
MAPRHVRGFTLVELLVALFVMAVLAALAWQGVDGMLRAREATQTTMDRTLRLNTVVTQWEQDLAALYETAAAPPLQFDGRTLRLTRRADTGVRVVAWTVRDGAWWRWTGPIVTQATDLQQSWLASQQLLGNEAGQLRAVEDVSDWQVYFFRGNAWSNAQSSADLVVRGPDGSGSAPPPDAREELPTGVRLVLTLPSGALTRDLTVPPQPE